jgi:hypothetical protein
LLKFSLPKSNALRFYANHFPALLLIAIAAWFSSLAMAELDDDTLAQAPDAITWPMLPGESLNQLAALFYPGNKLMQRRFIAKTRELSRELNPALEASTVFSQPGMLIIPELKVLSHHASPFKSHRSKPSLRMSYQIESIVTPEMNAQYEDLNQRNEFLKQQLQHLQERLTEMQNSLVQLKTAVLAFIHTDQPVIRASQPAAVKASPVQKPAQPEPAQQPAKAKPDQGSIQKPTQKPAKIRKMSPESAWMEVLIQFSLIVITLIGAILIWYGIRRRLFRQVEAATNKQIDAMAHNSFHITESSFDLVGSDAAEKIKNSTLFIEEIDSVTEEARILVSMDRPAQAALLLLNHVTAEPKASLYPWLYLLDIYRGQDQEEEFVALAKRLHTTFNVMTPQWEETKVAMVVASTLEEFPHIIPQLQEAWAASQAGQYLAALLDDNREGERAGFSLDVLQEIMLLQGVWEIRESIAD